jgi:hypothetical protein
MVGQDGASTIQATTPTRLHNGQLFGDHKLLPLLLSPRKNQKLPLVDKRGRLNVEIRGLPKTFLYWGDLFHTLVNMPNSRFIAILFCTYCLLFFGFAIPYFYDVSSFKYPPTLAASFASPESHSHFFVKIAQFQLLLNEFQE